MFKLIIAILLLTIAALGIVLLVQDDPGYLQLRYANFSIETSLAVGIAAVFLTTVLIHYCFRLLMSIWHLPGAIKRQSDARRFDKSRRLLNQGLIDLAGGEFAKAEQNLIKMVDSSESPLLHYLAAARAAQLQGKHDERDNYLKAAHEARPEAQVAIGVTQAELQLAHQQTEQALATLTHLRGIAPRHDHLLRLLSRAYFELEDWTALVELLPDIRRKKLHNESRLKEMEEKAYIGYLDQVAISGERALLEKAWHKVPRTLQTEAGLIIHYLGLVNQAQGASRGAEQLVVKSLDHHWDNRLVDIYGQLAVEDPDAQLRQAEKWLVDYSKNEYLLLALGRICVRAKLWGKAQTYLEASIGAKALPASCLELAELLGNQLQQKERASKYYQKGLELCLAHER